MKKTLLSTLIALALMFSLTATVFAAGPVTYTIDVRNRTGAPVEFNYTGSDNIIHTITIAEGVTSLEIVEGMYNYWSSSKCGNIAGTMNISQQRVILMLDCSNAAPTLSIVRPAQGKIGYVFTRCLNTLGSVSANSGPGFYEYYFYDWNTESPTDWAAFGTFCYTSPAEEFQGEWANIWLDGEDYYYEFLPNGIANSPYGNCDGWNDYGIGFYYLGWDDVGGAWLDCGD